MGYGRMKSCQASDLTFIQWAACDPTLWAAALVLALFTGVILLFLVWAASEYL